MIRGAIRRIFMGPDIAIHTLVLLNLHRTDQDIN